MKLYIGYYDNHGQDTAEVYASDTGTKEDFRKYINDVFENDIDLEDIEGVYPLDEATDSEGNNYTIIPL